ncbi:MAG: BON domain-containing protein [Ginsengibacter sp.]
MENYNRMRYPDDGHDRVYDHEWDRHYDRINEKSDYNNDKRENYPEDREGDHWNNINNKRRDYNPDNDDQIYTDHSGNKYQRNYYNPGNYMNKTRNEFYNNRFRDRGWRDNNRIEDRNWWDKIRDEVESWFGDNDAKRRRRMDETFEGRHRGKGPKNYTRSSDRIKEDVSDKLSDDSFLDASEIEVDVKGNEVTLTGSVYSRYSKHRAEDLAEDVTGVAHVQNNLRVIGNSPQEGRDQNSKHENSTSSDQSENNSK